MAVEELWLSIHLQQSGWSPIHPMLLSVTTTQNGATKQTTFGYDAYNNVNDQKDFDWGSGAPGPLLRHGVTYYETGAYDSLPVYQQDLPSQINTYDGSGTLSRLLIIIMTRPRRPTHRHHWSR